MTSGHSWDGKIQNYLALGFTLTQGQGELVDNSLSAGATMIHITLDTTTNKYYYSDNGHGLDATGLQSGSTFSKRSEPTPDRHGRFGEGGKVALIQLTEGEGSALWLTRNQADGRGSELKMDFPKIRRDNAFNNEPHGITEESLAIWKDYAIASRQGVVLVVDVTPAVSRKLAVLITSKEVIHPDTRSLIYDLGRTYAYFLRNGLSIIVTLNGTDHVVTPIDLMEWEVNRKEYLLDIYRNPADDAIRVYYTNTVARRGNVGEYGYFSPDFADRRRDKFEAGAPPEAWELVGPVIYRGSYIEDRLSHYDAILAAHGYAYPAKGSGERDNYKDAMRGDPVIRNNKVVTHLMRKPVEQGDFSKRKIHADSRFSLSFAPTQTAFTLDDVFGVIINKSRIEEESIHKILRATLDELVSDFVKHIESIPHPPVSAVEEISVPSSVSSASEPVVVTRAPPTKATNEDLLYDLIALRNSLIAANLETRMDTLPARPIKGLAAYIRAVDKADDGLIDLLT